MEKINPSHNAGVKDYVANKIEYIFIIILFFTIFFRTFRYYIGIFTFTEHLTFLMAFFYITLQILNIERFNFNKTLMWIYFLFLSWFMYGLISFFFSIDHDLSMTTLKFRTAHFLNFYVISQYLTNRKRIKIYEIILFICIIWNLGFSFWEVFTMNHLPMSRHYNIPIFIPSGTFPNENTLASVFLVCSTFLFLVKGKYSKYVAVTIIMLIFFIFCVQGARLALILYLPLMLYVFLKRTNLLYKLTVIFLLVFTVITVFTKFPIIKFYAMLQIRTNILSFGREFELTRIGSTEARIETLKVSIEEFVLSKGLGTGVGTFENLMYHPDIALKASRTINAHFMFAEVLTTEGVIGFILLFFIVFTCLKPVLESDQRKVLYDWLNLKLYTDDEKKAILYIIFLIVGTALIASYRTKYMYFNLLGYAYALTFNIPKNKDE